MPSDPFDTLREAIRLSPENLPLRLHLCETLLSAGYPSSAEEEYRTALAMWPDDIDVQVGLCRAFYAQGKNGEGIVLLEGLQHAGKLTPSARVMYAKFLARSGEIEEAVAHYRTAIDEDPDVVDDEFAERLGVSEEPGFEEESEVVDGKLRAGFEPTQERSTEIERPDVSFEDVGGMDNLKEEIRAKIIYPLEHAEMYAAYGKRPGGGVLMYGPPGCGKTHLARATAGEIESAFLSVGIDDVLDMWIGSSERNLHGIFEDARSASPCVLFFDEVDALGAKRSDMRGGAGRQLINQFLSEMDGVSSQNDGVLILAATNAPWHLDSAFRRPGRFDRILFVPPPDANARAEILRILCKGKPVKDIDFDHVAKKARHYSGADLRAIVDLAIDGKLAEAMKTGVPQPLVTKDLTKAMKKHRPTSMEWFQTARNHALYANESGLYDDILEYLKMS